MSTARFNEGRRKRGREWYMENGRRLDLLAVVRSIDEDEWADWYPDLCSALEASELRLVMERESSAERVRQMEEALRSARHELRAALREWEEDGILSSIRVEKMRTECPSDCKFQ